MWMTGQPTLGFDAGTLPDGSGAVSVHGLDPGRLAFFAEDLPGGGLLRSMFRVAVVPMGVAEAGDSLPDVCGRYEVSAGALKFIPRFPFARGVGYRASFDPRPVGNLRALPALTLEFSVPAERAASPAEVEFVFPSGSRLPENLLRFYVRFSTPMQRGQAEKQVALLDAAGQPVADVLYRAPVELWDRSMRHLTILLDPGRLKRGVGPNVALGPPLKEGREYRLVVGAGMLDAAGQPLREDFYKRFQITPAIREPVALEQWKLARPPAGSRQGLALVFPRPLDWAMLWRGITVESADGAPVDGEIAVNEEQRWSFVPTLPWDVGVHRVRVSPDLEDVCGNSVGAAFDGPLRSGSRLRRETAARFIPFSPERASG